jgi:hypothetical protein
MGTRIIKELHERSSSSFPLNRLRDEVNVARCTRTADKGRAAMRARINDVADMMGFLRPARSV